MSRWCVPAPAGGGTVTSVTHQYLQSRLSAPPVHAGWVLWAARMVEPSGGLDGMDVSAHQVLDFNGGDPVINGLNGITAPASCSLPAGSVTVLCSPHEEVPSLEALYSMLQGRTS